YGMAVDDRVYFSADTYKDGKAILAVPSNGGNLHSIGALPRQCAASAGVALDTQNAYAATHGCGKPDLPTVLVAVSRNGGGSNTLWSAATENITWIAARDGVVYFLTEHALMKVGADGALVSLATVPGM